MSEFIRGNNMCVVTQHGSVISKFLAPRIYFSRHYEREGWMLCALSLESPVYRVNYMIRQIACYCEGDLSIYDCPTLDVLEREIIDIHFFLVTDQCSNLTIDSTAFSIRYLDLVKFLQQESCIECHLNENSKLAFLSKFRDISESKFMPDFVFKKKIGFHQVIEVEFYFVDGNAIPILKMMLSSVSGVIYHNIEPVYFAFSSVELGKLRDFLSNSALIAEKEVCYA